MHQNDPFPASDFDDWAETYDQSIQGYANFPFAGYDQVLATILEWAKPSAGQTILDLGTGTGNLALLFDGQGCQLTCTDFSESMLEKARAKLPRAEFFLHDLRETSPLAGRHFDCIVSAYVFHHFLLEQKIEICAKLAKEHLMQGGSIILGDISFPSQNAQDAIKQSTPDWEEEFYWQADEALKMFEKAGFEVRYAQISACAGVYKIRPG